MRVQKTEVSNKADRGIQNERYGDMAMVRRRKSDGISRIPDNSEVDVIWTHLQLYHETAIPMSITVSEIDMALSLHVKDSFP